MTAFHTGSRGLPAFPAALLVTLLTLSACAPSYPPLASVGGDTVLKVRIATRYPPGSSGARLRADLVRDGFTVFDDPAARRFTALDVPANVPCLSETRIDWTENGRGRIVLIQVARHSCS